MKAMSEVISKIDRLPLAVHLVAAFFVVAVFLIGGMYWSLAPLR